MTKHSCQGYQLPTCGSLLHHSWYGCGNGSLTPASVTFQPSTSALVWFVWSPHLHQSAFTGVTSLSVHQSQTPKPAPPGKLERPSLCCCHCLLRILCTWNLLEIFQSLSTWMESQAPLPISTESPLMPRAQRGFSWPNWPCGEYREGATVQSIASCHFLFFSLYFPLGIMGKSCFGPCMAYSEA